jgi:hypothetical protein
VNRQVIEVTGVRERASATPALPAVKARAAPSPAVSCDPFAAEKPTLGSQQRWFARAITMPESEPGAVSDRDAERMLTAGPRLSAIERLEIYRRGYHARLIECLADDYAVLQHALGEAAFEDLCRAYIAKHPSSGPSLNFFGRRMAEFCGKEPLLPSGLRAFAADLAALEWAIVEVIHAPSSEPLTPDGLREVPMEAWAAARLVPNSASRLLRFEHPVNAYFQAFRSGSAPMIPHALASATVVCRSGPTVWRMDLTVPMFGVLSSLFAGESLGVSLARAETSLGDVDEQEAAGRVLSWFRDWVGSGLFARIELG